MANSSVCYTIGYNYVTSSNQYFPCGTSDESGAKAQSCCYAEDYCMENSMCHYTHGGVTNGTGYYMAGCTDPTWKDPACPKQCTSQYGADIIYDKANKEWRCCDSTEDSLDCQQPTEFVVEAADPEDLSTVVQLTTLAPSAAYTTGVGSVTVSNTLAISTSTTGGAKTTDADSPPAKPTDKSAISPGVEGLSTGGKAGIAIGVFLGFTLIVLAILIYLKWFRKKKKPNFERYDSADKSRSAYSLPINNANRQSGVMSVVPSLANRKSEAPSSMTNRKSAAPSSIANRNSAAPSTTANRKSAAARSSMANRRSAAPSPLGNRKSAAPSSIAERLSKKPPRSPDPNRESAIPEGLSVPTKKQSQRFSYELDGDYEMQNPEVLQVSKRIPYERPQSAQELEGTKVHPQEMDGGPADRTGKRD